MGLERDETIQSDEAALLQNSFGIEGDFHDEYPIFPVTKKSVRRYTSWAPEDEGVTLTWRDLSVYVPQKRRGFFSRGHKPFKRIINNVTGAVQPGNLVALMGASGAGKTTLMNTLAHRNPVDVVEDGDVRVNGRPVGDFMKYLSGYVYQEDIFIPSLTPREHLSFMAWLRLDRRLCRSERGRHVAQLLQHLGLTKCANTRIGGAGMDKGLSGGEKKRLAFATEILTDPPLLFCDEPTTGLDSVSAQKIVHMMKFMASKGKTILCTIHQPSSEIFALFHQLVLLADGRVAFIGSTEGALHFCSRLGYDCPPNYNPADFLIQTLAVIPGNEEHSRNTIKHICDSFAVTEHAKEVEMLVHYELHMASTSEVPRDAACMQSFKVPLWPTQLFWLTWRSMMQVLREPTIQQLRVVQKAAIALMAGLCYVGTEIDQKGIQAIQGALFIFVTENTFTPMYSVLDTFPQEMPLLMREHRSGLYGIGAYYLSKIISMLPGLIVEPFLFILIAYWLVGLKTSVNAFIATVFITVLTMNTSTACGYFFSAAFESAAMALACLVPFDYILMATSGLFIQLSSMPPQVAWLKYLSWLMYSNEALSIVQWDGVHNISCDGQPDLPCITDGEEVLDTYSFSTSHYSRNILAMLALYLIFHFLAFLCICYRTRQK